MSHLLPTSTSHGSTPNLVDKLLTRSSPFDTPNCSVIQRSPLEPLARYVHIPSLPCDTDLVLCCAGNFNANLIAFPSSWCVLGCALVQHSFYCPFVTYIRCTYPQHLSFTYNKGATSAEDVDPMWIDLPWEKCSGGQMPRNPLTYNA